VIDTINNEIQSNPIRVYHDDGSFDDGWWTEADTRIAVCALKALPGVRGKIPFSQSMVRNNYEVPTIFLNFTVFFFGWEGQIGYEFLYSALERSRHWTVSQTDGYGFSDAEMQEGNFSKSVTISCTSYSLSYIGDLCECINYEIQNLKWEKYWYLFGLKPEVEFITVK